MARLEPVHRGASIMIGVDVGGTFTDVVVLEDGRLHERKLLTSADQSEGVVAAVQGASGDDFLHGTTIATNRLLEERGARVALVTTAGFEDVLEIGRQDRPALYDSFADRPRPLVERELRLGFAGDVEALVEAVREADPEVVAVALLESFADARPEAELARRLARELSIPVVRSSLVSPEFREFERVATTVVCAYLAPSVAGYLRSLDARLPMRRRLAMTSAGGLVPFAQAADMAGRLLLSGPAGGVVAAAAVARHHGYRQAISFDMGGTSTDVCRIEDGVVPVRPWHAVGRRANRVPAAAVHSIGAGGGSIGWLDAGGALRVGPRSAGARPGPAAYARGGSQPTVTDANLVTGRIPADLRLGGRVPLDASLARQAVGRLGTAAGLGLEAAAMGMLEVVDSHMEQALRAVSVEEGADPREAVLVAFGGAGGLHASRLARRLGMRTVLVPPRSGVLSALGLLLATPRSDLARTVMLADDASASASLAGLLVMTAELRHEVGECFTRTFGQAPTAIAASADARYRGQSHELEVPVEGGPRELRASFEAAHRQRFGFSREGEPMEVVNLRAVASGEPAVRWADLPSPSHDRRPVGRAGLWRRGSLPPGHVLEGPATVVEADATVVLEAGDRLTVLGDGTLEIVP